jgi:3-oxoacyl-[acyl-carrier protein] reductase
MDNIKPIAVISGASSGIGEQLSIKLANLNYKVILISRNKDKLLSIKKSIKKNNQKCQIIVADISKPDIIDKLKSQIEFPSQISVLINNAGIGLFDKIQDISIDDWNQQINTNLRGSFLLSQFFVPFMIDNKFGKILFMNSVAGLNPYPYATAYVASKYALRGFSSSLREELREHNIKVISIHPGAVDTPLWDKAGSDFPKIDMMSANDVADMTIQAIIAPNNVVCEEIVIRRTAGDFK